MTMWKCDYGITFSNCHLQIQLSHSYIFHPFHIHHTYPGLPGYWCKFARATGRAIATFFKQGGGKSGQRRAMHRLRAGVITARAPDTDSATENNRPASVG